MTSADIIALGAAAAAFVCILLILLAILIPKRKPSPLETRLARIAAPDAARQTDPLLDSKADPKTRRRAIETTLKALDEKEKGRKTTTASLRLQLDQAGLTWPEHVFYSLSAGLGVVLFIGTLIAGFGFFMAIGVGFAGGAGLPRFWLSQRRNKRCTLFSEQFADALDIMARGLRSGLPLSETVRMIAEESPDPVGSEFRAVLDSQGVGLPLDQALVRLQERMPVTEVSFFATALQIQQQTGGNLSETLANLSNVLRGRKQLKGKIGALSAEGRVSAMIIGTLPFLVLGGMAGMSPGYVEPLFTTLLGQIMLGFGGTWMGLGIFLMVRMINIKV